MSPCPVVQVIGLKTCITVHLQCTWQKFLGVSANFTKGSPTVCLPPHGAKPGHRAPGNRAYSSEDVSKSWTKVSGQTAVITNVPTFQHFPWARHSLDHSGAIAGLGPTQSCEEDSIIIYLYRCYGFHRDITKSS